MHLSSVEIETADLDAPRVARRVLAGLAEPPGMVVDARPSGVRRTATATYGLVASLDLRRACPVAIHVPDARSACAALSLLLRADAVDGSGSPLLVVCGRDEPPAVAAFAVAGCAHEALGTRVAARTGAAAPAGSGSGFFDFATEVAAGVERCRRDRVDKVITESLAILVAGDE